MSSASIIDRLPPDIDHSAGGDPSWTFCCWFDGRVTEREGDEALAMAGRGGLIRYFDQPRACFTLGLRGRKEEVIRVAARVIWPAVHIITAPLVRVDLSPHEYSLDTFSDEGLKTGDYYDVTQAVLRLLDPGEENDAI